MSNKHVNHQHGLTTMNSSRPKSKLYKRRNKAKGKASKEALFTALNDAIQAAKKPGSTPTKPAKAAPKNTAKKETAKVVPIKKETEKKEVKEPVQAEQTSIAA